MDFPRNLRRRPQQTVIGALAPESPAPTPPISGDSEHSFTRPRTPNIIDDTSSNDSLWGSARSVRTEHLLQAVTSEPGSETDRSLEIIDIYASQDEEAEGAYEFIFRERENTTDGQIRTVAPAIGSRLTPEHQDQSNDSSLEIIDIYASQDEEDNGISIIRPNEVLKEEQDPDEVTGDPEDLRRSLSAERSNEIIEFYLPKDFGESFSPTVDPFLDFERDVGSRNPQIERNRASEPGAVNFEYTESKDVIPPGFKIHTTPQLPKEEHLSTSHRARQILSLDSPIGELLKQHWDARNNIPVIYFNEYFLQPSYDKHDSIIMVGKEHYLIDKRTGQPKAQFDSRANFNFHLYLVEVFQYLYEHQDQKREAESWEQFTKNRLDLVIFNENYQRQATVPKEHHQSVSKYVKSAAFPFYNSGIKDKVD